MEMGFWESFFYRIGIEGVTIIIISFFFAISTIDDYLFDDAIIINDNDINQVIFQCAETDRHGHVIITKRNCYQEREELYNKRDEWQHHNINKIVLNSRTIKDRFGGKHIYGLVVNYKINNNKK